MSNWFARMTCDHHWHREKGSERKVKNSSGPICKKMPEDRQKYVDYRSFHHDHVKVKYIRYCCLCGKKQIGVEYPEFEKTLAYPDIEDEPLKID